MKRVHSKIQEANQTHCNPSEKEYMFRLVASGRPPKGDSQNREKGQITTWGTGLSPDFPARSVESDNSMDRKE